MAKDLRAVIKGRDRPVVEQLLELTGIESTSALLSIMLSRYAQHMKETWQVTPGTTQPGARPTTGTAPTMTRPDDGELFI